VRWSPVPSRGGCYEDAEGRGPRAPLGDGIRHSYFPVMALFTPCDCRLSHSLVANWDAYFFVDVVSQGRIGVYVQVRLSVLLSLYIVYMHTHTVRTHSMTRTTMHTIEVE
jgi:hypothetical protein